MNLTKGIITSCQSIRSRSWEGYENEVADKEQEWKESRSVVSKRWEDPESETNEEREVRGHDKGPVYVCVCVSWGGVGSMTSGPWTSLPYKVSD